MSRCSSRKLAVGAQIAGGQCKWLCVVFDVRVVFFFFSSRRRHTRFDCDWSSDVCSSDLNPDLKWRQSAKAIEELTQKQAAILASAARLVKPGGRLVYATCSVLPQENEADRKSVV